MAMQLTERQADVVRLREEEGLSWSAVGKRLGISKSSANSCYRGVVARREARPKARGNTCEVVKPDETAAALDRATDPFTSIRQAAKDCGFPKRTLDQLIKRMKTRYGPLDAKLREVKNEQMTKLLEDRAYRCFEYLDDFVLGQASARDLAIAGGVSIDKLRLLKGEPTVITSYEDIRKIDEIAVALRDEIERRQRLIDVTPEPIGETAQPT